ncbi:TetR/AcrR family transcriptional regulator [Hoeflea sp. WL0058]|uniref:TetR/AcrR family transcriptional regulator n=1 Tax=Flavimaribacter sediminis TaxID=2865987 RepID=A0AAE3D2C3_9HYPH|nr:TetR/AcrR family transcriptional regulator [Flavimaribacter sediminis]MBW8638453.1 TetR/AcrR family transcriptional regulator [Flavimaribacter sediminis]
MTTQESNSAGDGATSPSNNRSRDRQSSARTPRNLSQDERRERIISLSAHLFLDKGYDNVSMNDIIEAAGGSKATIYHLFGNKEGLFVEVVRQMAHVASVSFEPEEVGTVEDQLNAMGCSFLGMILQPEILELHRLMVSMGKTFPGTTKLFFDAGPKNAYRHAAQWVERHQRMGELAPGDPQELATLFLDMLIGDFQLAMLTSDRAIPGADEIARRVAAAARLFLRGCAAR